MHTCVKDKTYQSHLAQEVMSEQVLQVLQGEVDTLRLQPCGGG